MAHKLAEKLADLIEKHPNCTFKIDNDGWWMENAKGKMITDSDKFDYDTDWYGNSGNYGAAIAEAMIVLLNRNGFNIQAEAV
jgi:hypothetical protein